MTVGSRQSVTPALVRRRAQYAVCEGETLYLYAEFGRLRGLRFMEIKKDF